MPTFEECARIYIASLEASWKNEKHRRQWSSTLKSYVYPVFGNKPVNEVGIDDVMKVLKPIWHEKPQTAGNIRGRIDKVLGWATAMGYRTGDNPASRTGPIEHLLPSLGKMKRGKRKHHAAVPYRDVPAVVAEIGELTSVSSRALLFTILTAARTSEALLATWDEINLDEKLWTLSADRMKAGAEHKVPLWAATVDLIAGLPRTSEYLFPSAKAPTLSNMAMLQCLRGVRDDGATVHGFRSSFSTWAREQTDYSPEIIEAALAHQQADKVVAAYARTTYLDRRRELMEAWGRFCLGG
ncbi:MAG: site-specific integrase [Mesorhizobium sp.]|nr:site-specific integrase [Mesorhizobium sp.]